MCKISGEAVLAILEKGRIYEVGGAVRDRLLSRAGAIKERDYLVCGIPYQELSQILNNFGKVDLVGRSFGVIKFTQFRGDNKYTFDIALPRKEYSIGVGHKDFEMDFDPNMKIEDDLLRRDFTINAMAMPLGSDSIIDPAGGLTDIKKGLIRMISANSFPEDPLRMLRAIQFAARLKFQIEPGTLGAIKENAALIETVSAERIADELNKLLTLADEPSEGFRVMRQTGLLKHILPELEQTVGVDQPGGFHKYDVFEHTLHMVDVAPKSLVIRLAALFHDITKPQAKQLVEDGATFYGHEKTSAMVAVKIMKRLRYSSEMIGLVSTLVERHMFTTAVTDKGLRRLIRKVGQDLIFDLLELRRADIVAQGRGGTGEDVDQFEKEIRQELERRPPFGVSDLALNGNDIMKIFHLPQSPLVGRVLNYLLEKVLDEPSDNVGEKLMELARSYLADKNI
ncbi:MAG: HDIG domain-containing protein [candidate division Zixibacteria bacterium]|nr:HDIG domain-containing protein [candidate division Zixibacteria bacterium]